MTVRTNISKKIFHDELYAVLLDRDGYVTLSRAKNRQISAGDPLSTLFDRKTLSEIKERMSDFSARPILADSHGRPALIFCYLYHSTLTALVSLPEVDMDTAICYARKTGLLSVSDILKQSPAYTEYKRAKADRSKFFILRDILKTTHTPLLKASTYIPALSKDIPADLLNIARSLSVACGCNATVSIEERLTQGTDEPLTSELDVSLYAAALVELFLFARRFSSNRRAHVCIGTKKNSPFVTVSFDSVPKALGGTDVSAKELCYIRSVFERLDSLFYFTCDGARFSACFSPARIDWSLVGIKLEDGRLICDLDRDA